MRGVSRGSGEVRGERAKVSIWHPWRDGGIDVDASNGVLAEFFEDALVDTICSTQVTSLRTY